MLKAGKLDSELLKKIVFENIKYKNPEVLTRASVGEDCAVMEFGDYEVKFKVKEKTLTVQDVQILGKRSR